MSSSKPHSSHKKIELSQTLREIAADAREWVSFTDGEGDTWMFDLSFFASKFNCIYGNGCLGIGEQADADAEVGCCVHGAHFDDSDDLAETIEHAARLTSGQWQHKTDKVEDAFGTSEGADVTKIVDDACIFLNRPGFAGGVGCALHIGAEANDARPLDWKPDVCWQVPLRLDELEDDNGHRIWVLRSWDRKDWGSGGTEFEWWCTEDHLAFTGAETTAYALEDEIVEMVGEDAYAMLISHIQKFPAARTPTHPAAVPVAISERP